MKLELRSASVRVLCREQPRTLWVVVQVRPLRRQLKGLKAWITGQRKDQSPGTRQAVPVVQVGREHLTPRHCCKARVVVAAVADTLLWKPPRWCLILTLNIVTLIILTLQVDPVFEGLDGGEGSLIKYNPLSNMSSAETWNFLRVMVRAYFYTLVVVKGSRRRQTCKPVTCLHGKTVSHKAPCLMLVAPLRCRACPPMSCTTTATCPSAASHARGRCCPTSMSARAAGGGRCAFCVFDRLRLFGFSL